MSGIRNLKNTFWAAAIILLMAATGLLQAQDNDQEPFEEEYRPQFHYTPETNWMNDPNGMVYRDGTYHLFYQHNPYGTQWGHLSWGHAVSSDMIHWEHKPVALKEENNIMIWSGSAVVDKNNSSGFGSTLNPPLVAIYTGHHTNIARQDQRLAYSTDNGEIWHKYAGNPVLDIGSSEFRDPKVFWHKPTGKWVMAVALPIERKIQFYGSENLKEWNYLSDFGPRGSVSGLWECPELFKVPVEGTSEQKWVLQIDVGDGAYAGGSGAQYFVGDFNGTRFIPEQIEEPAINEILNRGTVIADFESGSFGEWEVTGNAFGNGPVTGTLEAQQPVTGFLGDFVINSYHQGDGTTGTLTSPKFTLDTTYVSFLVGGGNHPETAKAELIVDSTAVKSATGRNSERLRWVSWDVSQWKGKEARIRLTDEVTGGWGHILFDHLILTDEPVPNRTKVANWVDYGADFYAAQAWNNTEAEDGSKRWLAWMSNWNYAGGIPTSTWRGAMAFPRKVKLRKYDDGIKLVQQPVETIKKIREEHFEIPSQNTYEGQELLKDISGRLLEIRAVIKPIDTGDFGFYVRQGKSEVTMVGYDVDNEEMYVDRTNSANTRFSGAFPAVHRAPLPLIDGRVELRILVDESSVEVFGNGGRAVITDRIFPSPDSDGLEFYIDGYASVKEMEIWKLRSMFAEDTGTGLDEQESPVNPEKFSLEQNYPNPFNPTTRIEYSVAEAGPIKLEVFNLLGQKVETLVEKNQSPGRYTANFDASSLASGVYIYRLRSGNEFVRTKRMTLIK